MPPGPSTTTQLAAMLEASHSARTAHDHAAGDRHREIVGRLDRLIGAMESQTALEGRVRGLEDWRLTVLPHIEDVAAAKKTTLGTVGRALLAVALTAAGLMSGLALPRLIGGP